MKQVFRKTLLLGILAIGGLALTPRMASADATGYLLNTPNAALSAFTGPYALVLVSTPALNSAIADILFLSNYPDDFWFGDGSSVDVNTNGAATISNIAATGCRDGSCATFVDDGSKNVSDFGTFSNTLKATGGGGESGWQGVASQISFTLTKTAGTWANAASVLALNSDGFLAAAHIFVGAADADDATATGFAGTGGTTTTQTCFGCETVPDGGMTISLLGMAMAGLGLVARFRK